MNVTPKRILIAEPEYYSPEALALYGRLGSVDWVSDPQARLEDLCEPYQVIVVRLAHRVTAAVFERAKNLEVIGTSTTGLDHIEMALAEQKKIPVLSLRGETAFLERIHATPEHTMGILLALLRRLPSALASVHRGEWEQSPYQGRELYEKTVALIGFGRVAKIMARALNALGARVVAYDPYVDAAAMLACGVERVDTLEDALRQADIVSLHPLLTKETEGMMTRERIAQMKPGAILVNTARGQLVDEAALLDALQNGHLVGAALDTLADESQPSRLREHPLVAYAREHEHLLITPHIAGTTRESLDKTQIFIAEKILSHYGIPIV